MFKLKEQSFKSWVNGVGDGTYDVVTDRNKIVLGILRADKSITYAQIAFENGYYLANGHLTIEKGKLGEEHFGATKHSMEWLGLYSQPVYRCGSNTTKMRPENSTEWVLIEKTDSELGYLLSTNIHWSQALVGYNGSLPKEKMLDFPPECFYKNGVIESSSQLHVHKVQYSGWFHDLHGHNEEKRIIDADDEAGVGQESFAFAELWGVDLPQAHFEEKTKLNYDFQTFIWPDGNKSGNRTKVNFQNESGYPMIGLSNKGITDEMYRMNFDFRQRLWYQTGKALYDKSPIPPDGTLAYHHPIISWFPMYVWQIPNPDLAIGMVTPLYGPDNSFAGVLTADISVLSISNFLKTQIFGKAGVGYVVRDESFLHSHGGVGIDEYISMSYNNHIGALLGSSEGSSHGIGCGNDYTNNKANDKYGPHYKLEETIWVNNMLGKRYDYLDLEEMILPELTFYEGGWECRLKSTNEKLLHSNRALPAQNHEHSLISGSAKHISEEGGFGAGGLLANGSSGEKYISIDGQACFLHWMHVNDLEFPGFSPLVIVVVPRKDYLGEVDIANDDASRRNNDAKRNAFLLVFVSILCAIILSIFIALLISVPLQRLSNEFSKMGKLEMVNIDDYIDDRAKKEEIYTSCINEISSMEFSFKHMKRGLISFSKFVPISVVKRIVSGDVSASKLGVHKRDVTIMFVDIRNFTTLVEELPLETVMELLEEYLTAMVSVIERNGGTVGDFIGDCIMSFWNSPLDQPNHAQLAVDTMFGMQEKLKEWNQLWNLRGLGDIGIRIGVNSGEVLSGNIGSPIKMKFGVVGDDVNLASRVENLNKYYGTTCIITESTHNAVADTTICRPVDKVAVKGRVGVTLLYEPLGDQNHPDAAKMQKVAHSSRQMINHFWAQEFDEVIKLADFHLSMHPDDYPILHLLDRTRNYLINPPGPAWDGVNRMKEK